MTIDGNGAETINGQPTVILEYPYSSWDLYTDGTRWFGSYTNSILPPVKEAVMKEEFATIGTLASTNGEQGWRIAANGGTGSIVLIDGEVDHAGIMHLQTAGALGNDNDLWLGSGTTTLNFFDPDDTFDITMVVRIPTITSIVVRVGANLNPVSVSEDASENAMFRFAPATDASWECRTRSAGGVDQSTDSTVDVVAATWYKLRIVKDGGTIRFFINDVNRCNHSLQVPSNPLTPFYTIDTTAAVVRTMDVDLFYGKFIMDGR